MGCQKFSVLFSSAIVLVGCQQSGPDTQQVSGDTDLTNEKATDDHSPASGYLIKKDGTRWAFQGCSAGLIDPGDGKIVGVSADSCLQSKGPYGIAFGAMNLTDPDVVEVVVVPRPEDKEAYLQKFTAADTSCVESFANNLSYPPPALWLTKQATGKNGAALKDVSAWMFRRSNSWPYESQPLGVTYYRPDRQRWFAQTAAAERYSNALGNDTRRFAIVQRDLLPPSGEREEKTQYGALVYGDSNHTETVGLVTGDTNSSSCGGDIFTVEPLNPYASFFQCVAGLEDATTAQPGVKAGISDLPICAPYNDALLALKALDIAPPLLRNKLSQQEDLFCPFSEMTMSEYSTWVLALFKEDYSGDSSAAAQRIGLLPTIESSHAVTVKRRQFLDGLASYLANRFSDSNLTSDFDVMKNQMYLARPELLVGPRFDEGVLRSEIVPLVYQAASIAKKKASPDIVLPALPELPVLPVLR